MGIQNQFALLELLHIVRCCRIYYSIDKMKGAKGILPPMIPDCFAFYAPGIIDNKIYAIV